MQNNEAKIEYVSDGVLALSGNINANTAVSLQKEGQALILAQANSECIINLDKVSQASSVGVALLTVWLRFAKSNGKIIHYRHMPNTMLAIVELSGLNELLVQA